MHIAIKVSAAVVTTIALAVGGAASWYLHSKQPKRTGTVQLVHLTAPVRVDYDERGVPHIQADNEADKESGKNKGEIVHRGPTVGVVYIKANDFFLVFI